MSIGLGSGEGETDELGVTCPDGLGLANALGLAPEGEPEGEATGCEVLEPQAATASMAQISQAPFLIRGWNGRLSGAVTRCIDRGKAASISFPQPAWSVAEPPQPRPGRPAPDDQFRSRL